MSFTLLLCVDDEMIYRQQQDATAINLRMGSGGRLTSRRCHEITWPSSAPPLISTDKRDTADLSRLLPDSPHEKYAYIRKPIEPQKMSGVSIIPATNILVTAKLRNLHACRKDLSR
ncbi:hypothetical protein Rleg5DRAFT_2176 [Rhizobium leguminosarum bv. viciae WSM1455]|nr:hypothetical protein Rleg5DRAFT_2176 [Rhizobium leguminosarum bv. viciae WSM1455]